MNLFYLAAAILSLYGAGFHIAVGNKRIDNIIFATNIDIKVRTISRIVWHSITLFLILAFGFLAFGAFFGLSSDLGLFLGFEMFAMSGLFLYFCANHLNNPFRFPHPFYFAFMGLLISIGILF